MNGDVITPYFVRDVQRQGYRFGILIRNRLQGGMTRIATSIEFEPLEPNVGGPDLMTLTQDDVQAFMDELWNAGVRPTSQGSAGQLAATEKHLEDMRNQNEAMLAVILGKAIARV